MRCGVWASSTPRSRPDNTSRWMSSQAPFWRGRCRSYTWARAACQVTRTRRSRRPSFVVQVEPRFSRPRPSGSPAPNPKPEGDRTMRFMMLMIPKGYEKAAPGAMPDAKAIAAMMKYNESLQKAGVLLSLEGLHPPSMGARVSFAGGKPRVTDGPFAEAKEVLGGYWMIQVKSREEAI